VAEGVPMTRTKPRVVPVVRVLNPPCYSCDCMHRPRSACPECGLVVCQLCAEREGESCCQIRAEMAAHEIEADDVPPLRHTTRGKARR